jgi:hypothetical protein
MELKRSILNCLQLFIYTCKRLDLDLYQVNSMKFAPLRRIVTRFELHTDSSVSVCTQARE